MQGENCKNSLQSVHRRTYLLVTTVQTEATTTGRRKGWQIRSRFSKIWPLV